MTENISITIPDDLLNAVHAVRGHVPVARFFQILACKAVLAEGLTLSDKTMALLEQRAEPQRLMFE